MRKDLNEILLIVDRSGSMCSCRTDAEGGINTFIEEQKKVPGEARLTLVQFDTEYDFVHRAMPIHEVPPYTLVPRGSTALLDAIGRGVNETGKWLADTPEALRPGLVTVVIVTDGQENASREFSKAKVREMIAHQRTKYSWKFLFLGADENAVAQGVGLGINASAAAQYNTANSHTVYRSLSGKAAAMREAVLNDEEIPVSAMNFTAEDRQEYTAS